MLLRLPKFNVYYLSDDCKELQFTYLLASQPVSRPSKHPSSQSVSLERYSLDLPLCESHLFPSMHVSFVSYRFVFVGNRDNCICKILLLPIFSRGEFSICRFLKAESKFCTLSVFMLFFSILLLSCELCQFQY